MMRKMRIAIAVALACATSACVFADHRGREGRAYGRGYQQDRAYPQDHQRYGYDRDRERRSEDRDWRDENRQRQ